MSSSWLQCVALCKFHFCFVRFHSFIQICPIFRSYGDSLQSYQRGISFRRNRYIKSINSNHSSNDVLQLMSRFWPRVILEKVGILVFLVQKQHEVNVFFAVLACSITVPALKLEHTQLKNISTWDYFVEREFYSVHHMLICEISILS